MPKRRFRRIPQKTIDAANEYVRMALRHEGRVEVKVPVKGGWHTVLSAPMLFGPSRTMPLPAAISAIRRCCDAPSASISAKPELITIPARTPLDAHASRAGKTC